MKKLTILSVITMLLATQATAQNWLGLSFGNYAGTNGVYLNPSSIAESKYSYHLNAFGQGANLYTNALNYRAPFGLRDWARGDVSDLYTDPLTGEVNFDQSWLAENTSSDPKQLSLIKEVRMPAIMFPVGPKANMSVGLRQRSSIQAFSISAPFARVIRNGIDTNGRHFTGNNVSSLSPNTRYNTGDFSSNIENFQELAVTYAGNWIDNTVHKVNAGATVKFIRGLGAAYLNSAGGEFEINSQDSITLYGGEYSYAHTPSRNITAPFTSGDQFSYPSAGTGLGFDFGFTYLYNPLGDKYLRKIGCDENDKRDNYLIKFAAAVNDIGFINYTDARQFNRTFNTNGLNVTGDMLDFFNQDGVDGFDSLNSRFFQPLGFNESSGFISQLPTALNVSLDIRATKRFFLGVNLNQDLKRNQATGMRATSYLALLPRFELRGFEFSAPMIWGQNYESFNIGLYTKVGPFFFGSENINGLLSQASNTTRNGADFYAGVAFGLGHCPWWTKKEYEEEVLVEPVTPKDSIIRDSMIEKEIIETNDTIKEKEYITRVDTILQTREVLVRDTIIKYVTTQKVDEEIRQRELEVLRREREVAERERRTNCVQCEANRKVLQNRIVVLERTIRNQTTRIRNLEREVVVLKSRQIERTVDTIRISDCGPKIYRDEAGNKYDECEWNKIQIKKMERNVTFYKEENEKLRKELEDCKKGKSEAGNDTERLRELERQITILKAEKLKVDTVRISDCGPKIYKDESGNRYDKCEWLELKNRQLKIQIERLNGEKNALQLRINECERIRTLEINKEKEEARKRAENERIRKELERKRQEEARSQQERARQAAQEAARKKAEQDQREAQLRAQDAAKRKEEEKAKAQAARKAAEAAARQRAEQLRKQAEQEAARKAAEKARAEAARKAQEAARAEAARKAAEAAKKAAEAKAKAAAAKKAAEKAAQEAARKKAEEDRKRKENLK